jgi:hypothetical protein
MDTIINLKILATSAHNAAVDAYTVAKIAATNADNKADAYSEAYAYAVACDADVDRACNTAIEAHAIANNGDYIEAKAYIAAACIARIAAADARAAADAAEAAYITDYSEVENAKAYVDNAYTSAKTYLNL